MTPATGKPNANDAIAAWADVMVKMWRDRITQLPVIDTRELYNSFVMHIIKQAGGDLSKIEWAFKQYGIYQDMGVGRETARGNSGSIKSGLKTGKNGKLTLKREQKPWYSKTFYREVMKLKEYMAFWYAAQSTVIISEAFGQQIFDQRYKNKQTKTVGSLRTQLYRDRNNSRWRQNYKDFGFKSWKSRNNH